MKPVRKELMATVDYDTCITIGHALYKYTKGDTITYRLWNTDILTVTPTGVVMTSGGWRTRTTLEKLNKCLNLHGYQVLNVGQVKGQWYIGYKYGKKPADCIFFFDGITFDREGKCLNEKKSERKKGQDDRLIEQINKYCEVLKKRLEKGRIIPELGDCFMCMADSQTMLPKGKTFGGVDHLLMHIKEKHIHGSLIVAAIKWAGYGPGWFDICYRTNKDGGVEKSAVTTIVRAVRRYLKAQLGV
jgi:hypothetical protein